MHRLIFFIASMCITYIAYLLSPLEYSFPEEEKISSFGIQMYKYVH